MGTYETIIVILVIYCMFVVLLRLSFDKYSKKIYQKKDQN